MKTCCAKPFILVLVLISCTAHCACGVEGVGSTNTVITSKTLIFDYHRKFAYFEEDVTVRDPQVNMTSDRLTVTFEGTNQVKTATAHGNVHAVGEDAEAKCEKVVYMAEQSKIIMTGDAVVTSDRNRLNGDKITFWIDENRMTSQPGHLFVPEKDTNTPSRLQMDLDEQPERESDEQ